VLAPIPFLVCQIILVLVLIIWRSKNQFSLCTFDIPPVSCLGSRSGATPELIRDRQEGLLYEPGDHQDLARKIEYIIQHPEEAQQMGERGFQRASRLFTVKRYSDRIFSLLKELIN